MPWNVSTRPSRKGVDVNGAKLRHVADGDQRTPAIPACGNPSGKCSDVERAATDDRIVVSADTDFGALLAARTVQKPSVIQFRGPGSRKPDALAHASLEPCAISDAANRSRNRTPAVAYDATHGFSGELTPRNWAHRLGMRGQR